MHAVDGVSFDLDGRRDARRRRRVGLRQEHDRALHPAPDRADLGRGLVRGRDVTRAGKDELRALARDMQIIFQDPYASLNPRMTVGAIVGEALIDPQAGEDAAPSSRRASSSCSRPSASRPTTCAATRTSSRAASASASASPARSRSSPKLIVCDEAVSALDVSIQAQVINLLEDLQGKFGLTYLFIAHDLSVVEHISDRVAVMYLGRIVEIAPAQRALHAAAASLHRGAAVGGADPRPAGQAQAHPAAGRRAEPDPPAVGLPLPHPLPDRPVSPVQHARRRSSSRASEGHWVACHLRG